MFGTEKLKALIAFSLGLAKQVSTSLSDGFQWTDLFSFGDDLLDAVRVAKSFPEVVKEFKDLDATERKELVDYFAVEFDIPNDQIESMIEKALAQALNLIGLIEDFKKLQAAKPEE